MTIIEGKVIGIDLGTTYSVVSVMEGNEHIVINNPEGSNKTPSVVAFLDNNEIVVGEIARRQAVSNPQNTIASIKRIIGRSYSELEESNDLDFLPYKIVNQDDRVLININGMGYYPEQISALILKKLKGNAEDYLGEEVKQAIITVPAYFDDLQRQATIESANLAGLEVLRLINEPTAAAMAYGLGKESEEIVAVYDFGGGTFDITILEVDNNTFEVIHSTGDSHLGGDDLDNTIVERLVEDFFEKNAMDLSKDSIALIRMKEAAEKAKCELSSSSSTTINLPFIAQKDEKPLHINYILTVKEFEKLIKQFVERSIECCKSAISESGVKLQDISKVILVGGTTRIPLIREYVEDFFGIEPFKGVNPDEIVAMGAATQAGVLEGHLQEVTLIDVTPHSLGIEVKDNRRSVIIDKNSTLPIKAAKTFTTTENNQTFVNIHVLQGESENASDNKSLGKFILSGIAAASAGTPRIRVTFFINVDGILEISANDLQSGSEKTLTIAHAFLSSNEREKRKKKKKRKTRDVAFSKVRLTQEGAQGLAAVQLPPELSKDESDTKETAMENVQFQVVASSSTDWHAQTHDTQQGRVRAGIAVSDKPQVLESAKEAEDIQPPAPPKQPEPKFDETQSISDMEKTSENVNIALEYLKDNVDTKEAQDIYKEAIPDLKEWIDKHPAEIVFMVYLAKCYIYTKEPEESLKIIKKYRDSGYSDEKLIYSTIDLIVERYPNFVAARTERAPLAFKMGEFVKSMEDYEFLAEKEDKEEYEEILINTYEKFITNNDDPSVKFKLIKLYVKQNLLDESIELLQDLIKHGSYEERATKILGLCYWQKNLLYLAWQKFKTLPLNDEIMDILYRLARDMELAEQLNNSKIIYEFLLEKDHEYKDVEAKLKKITYRLHLQHEELDKNVPHTLFKDTRFQLIEEINRGSMGIVYKAKDKILDEVVALKVLNDYLTQDPRAVERFKREARAAKKLSHPNIVRIHDMFEHNNIRFISMEYIEGTDLKRLLNENKKFTLEEIVAILKQMCDALVFAHKINIIHRDIKPANIMITPDGSIKITDFGIAKILKTDDATKSGTAIIGTPLYMSPEQILGDSIDARSDIYSLGIMLYELYTGQPPFFQGNIEYHHIHTNVPPMPEDTPELIRRITSKCLQKKPEDRYQSIDEIRQELKDL